MSFSGVNTSSERISHVCGKGDSSGATEGWRKLGGKDKHQCFEEEGAGGCKWGDAGY